MRKGLEELVEGTQIGAYVLIRRLGCGGFGQVWLAHRAESGPLGVSLPALPQSRVALKILSGAIGGPIDLVSEWYQGRQVVHPNVVRILDVGSHDLLWFMAMEFIDGLTLRQLEQGARRLGARIPLDAIIELGVQAARGLGAVHDATDLEGRPLAMIHRDVKPDNLMLDRHGIVRLLDFGIAKGVDALALTQVNMAKGSPLWMAPEQHWADQLTPAADLFSLAAVLYEIRVGQPLFGGATLDELVREKRGRHARERLARDAELLGPLSELLAACLEPLPAHRPQTASEVESELYRLLAEFPRGPGLHDLYEIVRDERVPRTEQLSEEWATLAISLLGPCYPDPETDDPTDGELELIPDSTPEGPLYPQGLEQFVRPRVAPPPPRSSPPEPRATPRRSEPAQPALRVVTPPASPATASVDPPRAAPPRSATPARLATPRHSTPPQLTPRTPSGRREQAEPLVEAGETGSEPAASAPPVVPISEAEATWIVPVVSPRPPLAELPGLEPVRRPPAADAAPARASQPPSGQPPKSPRRVRERRSNYLLAAIVFFGSTVAGLMLVYFSTKVFGSAEPSGGPPVESLPPVPVEAPTPVPPPDLQALPSSPPPPPPGAEVCDGVDTDGDGKVMATEVDNDGDGFAACHWGSAAVAGEEQVEPTKSVATRGGDCDDHDKKKNPRAKESPGGPDLNCDGILPLLADADGDGSPAGEDCDDTNKLVNPSAEERPADGVDQNCDGLENCFMDSDRDGFGNRRAIVPSENLDCNLVGISNNGLDCRDEDPSIHFSAVENCLDGIDGDCDGVPDADEERCQTTTMATLVSTELADDGRERTLRAVFEVSDAKACRLLRMNYQLTGLLGSPVSGSAVMNFDGMKRYEAFIHDAPLSPRTLSWSVSCIRITDGLSLSLQSGNLSL